MMRVRTSLATVLFLVQFAAVLVVVGVIVGFTIVASSNDARDAAAGRTSSTGEAVARSFVVRDGLAAAARPSSATERMQSYVDDVHDSVGVSSIAIVNDDGHVQASAGDIARLIDESAVRAALRGEKTVDDIGNGPTSSASVRSIVPIFDYTGSINGAVVTGVDVSEINSFLSRRVRTIVLSAAGALLLLGLASWIASRFLSRLTRGRDAQELLRTFQFLDGAFHGIDEGIILLDGKNRVALMNDAAIRLLGIDDGRAPTSARADKQSIVERLIADLGSGAVGEEHLFLADDRALVVTTQPIVDGRSADAKAGRVIYLRDHTTVQELSGDLDAAATLTDALRSQAHEFANRLHTIIALMELGRTQEAIDFASGEVRASQSLADQAIDPSQQPVLSALLLGKTAQAQERGITLTVDARGQSFYGVPSGELVTIVGNLVDNAMDAAAATEHPGVLVEVVAEESRTRISVTDSGPGPAEETVDRLFRVGASTKQGGPRGYGLALVRQAVTRLHGTLTVSGSTFIVDLPTEDAELVEGRGMG